MCIWDPIYDWRRVFMNGRHRALVVMLIRAGVSFVGIMNMSITQLHHMAVSSTHRNVRYVCVLIPLGTHFCLFFSLDSYVYLGFNIKLAPGLYERKTLRACRQSDSVVVGWAAYFLSALGMR